uniref:Ferric oxidoreductase domain-containing protein n=2 Tax=Eutreptiella gymnastica TaxID=73025 RepID=A0A7S4LB31_9EUGL
MIATATGCWAALHASGEVVWFISQGSLMSSLNIVAKGENLIYVCGIIAAAALAMQVAISQVRHKIRYFRQMHRFFAVVLLLVAAAHWWPFTFFLIPATGVHATSVAIKQFVAQQELPHPATGHTGKALSCATLAATGAIALVWKFRQSYMMSNGAGMWLPFLFPPTALLAGFGAAFGVSFAVIRHGGYQLLPTSPVL